MIKCLDRRDLSSFIAYHRVCNLINTTSATSGAVTAYPSGAPEFTLVLSYSIFGFLCMFSRLLFVLFSFFFWILYGLSFIDLRILITPLISSNSSYDNNCVSGDRVAHLCSFLCFVFIFYLLAFCAQMLPVSMNCPFSVAHSFFSNV